MSTNYTLPKVDFNIIHVITILGIPFTLMCNALLLYMFRKRGSFIKRECGRQIKAIVMGSLIVVISSVPHVAIVLAHGNISCPQRLLAWLALPRVFTLRFELTQYTMLAVDRVVATVFLSTYHKRAMRIGFWLSMGISTLMSIIECCIYILRPYFNPYVNSCSIANGAGPYFEYYFFLVNMISYGIILAGTIIYGYEVTSSSRFSNRSSYSMIRFVFLYLCIFLVVLSVPSILIIVQQLTHSPSMKNYTGFYDATMNIMHVLPLILFTLFGRQSYKIHASAASSTSMVTMHQQRRSNRRQNSPGGNDGIPDAIETAITIT